MNKILIAYFSLKGETYVNGRLEMRSVGNTEVIAGKIEVLTHGNLFHIETVEPYPVTMRPPKRRRRSNGGKPVPALPPKLRT